jgi:hypothetical protein
MNGNAHLLPDKVKIKVYYDRRSVGQSVLVSGSQPNFLLLSVIIFRQLRVCSCGAPSLTRGRVCTFQLLLGIASAVFLGSESRGTHEHYLPVFYRDSERERGGSWECTLGWGWRKQYLRFRMLPGSTR